MNVFENLFRMPDQSRPQPQPPTMTDRIAKLEQFAGLVSRDMTIIDRFMQWTRKWGEDVDSAIDKLFMAGPAANTAGPPPGGPVGGSPAESCEAKPDYERLLRSQCEQTDRLRRVNADLALALEMERARVAELQNKKPPAPPPAPPKPKRIRNRSKKGKAAK